jgi:hypothetical protein
MPDVTVPQEELNELRRLAVLGRYKEQERIDEAKAAEELAAKVKQIEAEHRIAHQVVDQIRHDNARSQAEDDARIAEAVLKRMKAEEKRQAQKGKENLKKAVGTALLGALVGFYGSLIKTSVEGADNPET